MAGDTSISLNCLLPLFIDYSIYIKCISLLWHQTLLSAISCERSLTLKLLNFIYDILTVNCDLSLIYLWCPHPCCSGQNVHFTGTVMAGSFVIGWCSYTWHCYILNFHMLRNFIPYIDCHKLTANVLLVFRPGDWWVWDRHNGSTHITVKLCPCT